MKEQFSPFFEEELEKARKGSKQKEHERTSKKGLKYKAGKGIKKENTKFKIGDKIQCPRISTEPYGKIIDMGSSKEMSNKYNMFIDYDIKEYGSKADQENERVLVIKTKRGKIINVVDECWKV